MFDERFCNGFENRKEPANAAGWLLVASPRLAGTPFERSAVFVVQDNEYGTFGVTLNRPVDREVSECLRQTLGVKTEARDVVLAGGPVAGPVLAIHQNPELAEIQIGDEVYVSVQAESIDRLLEDSRSPFRIALGMLAWSPGQLAGEIKSGLWFPMLATVDDVFGDPHRIWLSGMRRFGREQLQMVTGIAGFPEDPLLN